MWTCPQCDRTFKNTEQSHYCGKAPSTIEEYILGQTEEVQARLRKAYAEDVFSHISGTTAINGAVDSSFMLVEDRRGSKRANYMICVFIFMGKLLRL